MGIFNVIRAARENGIRSIVAASSSEVYQRPRQIPTPEAVELIVPDASNPRYSYGGSKILTELAMMNASTDDFDVLAVFRPHNIYGPDMGFEHVIPQIIKKIMEANGREMRKINIHGDGSQTRAFMYIDDFIRALRLMIKNAKGKSIIHIGVEDEVEIKHLVRFIGDILGFSVDIAAGEVPIGETDRRCPNVSKLRELGFSPQFSLEAGLFNTVNWYRNFYVSGKN